MGKKIILAEVRTPHLFVIKINENETHGVIYSEKGRFNKVLDFLDFFITASEQRQP